MNDYQIRFDVEYDGICFTATAEHKGVTVTEDYPTVDGVLKWHEHYLDALKEDLLVSIGCSKRETIEPSPPLETTSHQPSQKNS